MVELERCEQYMQSLVVIHVYVDNKKIIYNILTYLKMR